MSEVEAIKERYKKRDKSFTSHKNTEFYFSYFQKCERELKYLQIIRSNFGDKLSQIKLLEIGAGDGVNLIAFKKYGFSWDNLSGNELIIEYGERLKKNILSENVYIGDALELNFQNNFDIVFQSTVFTSILDDSFKKKLADKMFEMTKQGGLILWYDFKYNNPKNKDVKGIGKNEIRELFSHSKKIEFHNVTIAPPIGRKVKRFYNLFNFMFPFLRTHVIAVIKK